MRWQGLSFLVGIVALCVFAPAASGAIGTAAPTAAAPANSAPPTISGSPAQGNALTESHGTWSGSPTGYGYQWQDCDTGGANCSDISGATGQTYVLAASDVGQTVRVLEWAANGSGATGPVASAPTRSVQSQSTPPPPTGTPPVPTASPVISGLAEVDRALSATTGTWTGTGPISYSYQWQRCKPGCVNVPGATTSTYLVSVADLGASLQAVVTATNSAGSTQADSNILGPVIALRGEATQLQVTRPARVCATISTGSACLGRPRADGLVNAPGGAGWTAEALLTNSSGQPMAGAQVRIIDGASTTTTQTNARGRASFSVARGANRAIRLVYPGSSNQEAAAASIRVADRAAATLRLVHSAGSGKVLLAGVAVSASGARTATTVELQALRSGRWVTVATVHSTSGTGWWSATIRSAAARRSLRTRIDGIASTAVSLRIN